MIAAKRTEPHPERSAEARDQAGRRQAAAETVDLGYPEPAALPPPAGALVAGAQPIVPANSFDSRFSAAK